MTNKEFSHSNKKVYYFRNSQRHKEAADPDTLKCATPRDEYY